MLKLEVQNHMQVGTLQDTDRLNATVAPDVKEELNRLLSGENNKFVLNLQNIKFIDSSGIAVLISALKTARQKNGSFLLCNVQDDVMSLLKLMKLDKVFDFYSE